MVRLSFQIIRSTEIPTVVVSYDNSRYIFNVPEGFQRYYREHKVRMTPGPIFFFTRSSPEVTTGIVGFMLTLHMEQLSRCSRLYGPSQLGDLFSILRYFEGYKTFPFSYYDLQQQKTRTLGLKNMELLARITTQTFNKCYIQEQIEAVKSVRIDVDTRIEDQNNAGDQIKHNQYFEDENISVIPIILTSLKQEQKNHNLNDCSIQYIITSKSFPGKVQPDKLAQYKITKQMLPILFKQGQIQLDDGSIINESDIRSSDVQRQSIIILDIIDTEDLNQLLSNQQFRDLMQNYQAKSIILQSFIHMTKSELVMTDQYQTFLKSFPTIDHVFCNLQEKKENIEIIKSIQVCNVLNKYFPQNFPSVPSRVLPILSEQQNFIGYRDLYEYTLIPQGKQYSLLLNSDQDYIKKTLQFRVELQNKLLDIQTQLQQLSIDERSLIFLGTGSMKPGKYRNVSSILIQMAAGNILMDCGEGTLKQLQDQSIDILLKPLLIWISHAHTDHNLGLFNLIYQVFQRQASSTVYLAVPSFLLPFVYYYNKAFKCFIGLKLVIIQHLESQYNQIEISKLIREDFHQARIRDNSIEIITDDQIDTLIVSLEHNRNELNQLLKDLNITQFVQIPVDHCPQAYGIAIKWQDGYKLSYSGDTRPCDSFIHCSQKANIMIHEATFTDDLQENAIQNMHSTVREAVESAIQSQSDNLVLTHFSQRYAKTAIKNKKQKESPNIQVELHKYSDDVYKEYLMDRSIYAVDHMKGKFDQYQNMVQMSHLIGQLLPDDE